MNNTCHMIKVVFILLKLKTMGTNVYALEWNYKHDFKALFFI